MNPRKIARKLGTVKRWVGSRYAKNSVILIYHRIADVPIAQDPFKLCVSPHNFEQQLQVLREIGQPVSVSDLVVRHHKNQLEKGSISISVDDGFLDVAENGLPLCDKYNVPMTLYVVSGRLGQSFWWDELQAILDGVDELPSKIEVFKTVFETDGCSKTELFSKIYSVGRELAPEDIEGQLERLSCELFPSDKGEESIIPPRLMTETELQDFASHPLVDIGAHSIAHRPLQSMSCKDQYKEIAGSVKSVSEVLNQEIRTFSYPFGLWNRDFDASTVEMVKKAGLDHALAAEKGTVKPGDDPYRLSRVWVHNWTGEEFRRFLKWWM